jgi:O-antigen ligase/Tfp pilus assembly protein PilF
MTLTEFLEKSIKGILYATPALLLVFYQGTLYPFLTLKTSGLYIFVAIIALLWAALVILKKGEHLPRITKVNGALFLFICIATISGLVSETPLRSIWSTPERLTGVVTLWVMFVYSLALSTFIKKEEWKTYLTTAFVTSALVGVSTLVQRISPETFFVKSGSRPGGTLGNPSYLAGYLISYLFLGYALIKNAAKGSGVKVLLSFSLFFGAFAFFGANTRGAILGLVFAITYLLISFAVEQLKESKSRSRYLLIAGGIVLLLCGTVYVSADSPVWAKIPGMNRIANFSLEDSSVSNRLIEWRLATKGFLEYPAFGVGYENFRIIADSNYDPRLLRGGFSDTYFDKPHNVPLEILSTTGAVGFLAYAFLWILIISSIRKLPLTKLEKRLAIAAAIAFFIQNCFIFDTFGTHLTFAIAIAAISVNTKDELSLTKKAGSSSIIFCVTATALSCLLIFTSISMFIGSKNHYKMLSSFLIDKSEQGIGFYNLALSSNYPFKTALVTDVLSSVVERVRAAKDPKVGTYIPRVLSDIKAKIIEEPRNYYIRIALADAKTVFFRLDKNILEGVEKDIEAAEAVSPNRQQTLFVKAKVKLLKGDREGAFLDMKAAIALDPQAAMPYYNYAKLLAQFTAGKEVIKAFDDAFAKGYKTNSPSELAMLGGYYGDANEYEKAYHYFKWAYELDPGNNEYLAKYGLTSFYTQRTKEAKQIFTQLLKVMPELKDSPNYPAFLEIFKEIGVTPL